MTAPERLLGGRYEVGELLGYGGMAEVHRGRDLRLNRDVAVKMLRTDLARDNTFQMRFRREAQNAATLNHPGIVAVYDTGEEHAATGEALPYIVMEYVDGRTLKDILAAEQRLQPRAALEIAADICAALEFSHRHGIVHRDVKPGNVMITPGDQVKVMDFGIARDLASGATTMTQTSAVIGTAQYLSPEQARGESVDARSDVYATGCVLFELLVGHPPFVGDSPVSVAYQHVREDPRPPSDLNPEVGPDVDAVVLKALSKNPANRYQSAAEMRADLLRAASGRQVLATPVMPAEETAMIGQGGGPEPARVGDPERRRASTWVLVALGVLGVLAVIALVVGLVLASQTPDEVDVPDVVGMSEDDAVAELRAADLEPEPGTPVAEDCTQSEDEVERLEPAAGESLEEGSTVVYHMCTAPDVVEIPMDLGGSNADLAEQELTGLGLEVERTTEESAQDQGTVIRTEPEGGATVEVGSSVDLVVSGGGIVTVPDVVGDSVQRAEGRLEQAGFVVENGQTEEAPPSPEDAGTVARQDPPGGEEASQDSTVTIYLYPEGQELAASAEILDPEAGTVELTWDNDIYGDVEIVWGDGNSEIGGAAASSTHTYEVEEDEPAQFEITVSAQDDEYADRTVTVTVDFSADDTEE